MPNDLGQPLNRKIRNNCDLNMIYWITSQKERDVQGSTCGWARLNITELSSNKSEFRADQVH